MLKTNKAVSLFELLVSISLIGLLILTINGVGSSVYRMKRDILDRQQPLIQGTLATALIFERVLRASAVTNNAAFTIPDAEHLEYRRAGSIERIWKEGDVIKYSDGASEKIILRNVNSLQFSPDFEKRLAVEITLKDNINQVYRTAVQPRNQFTPASVIN